MIRALVFDMDGTIVRYETGNFHSSWDALGHTLCDIEKWDAALDKYYGRPELYHEWISHNAMLLKGAAWKDAEPVMLPAGKPPYSPGVRHFFQKLDSHFITGIISSGLQLISEFIMRDLGLTFEAGNYLELKGGIFTGRMENRVPLWEKDKILKNKLDEYGISFTETLYVGDHENDIPALKAAGVPVLINPKPPALKFAREYNQTNPPNPIRIISHFSELHAFLQNKAQA